MGISQYRDVKCRNTQKKYFSRHLLIVKLDGGHNDNRTVKQEISPNTRNTEHYDYN